MLKPLSADLVQHILTNFEADFTAGRIYRKTATSRSKAGSELPQQIYTNGHNNSRQEYRVNIRFNKRNYPIKASRVIFILYYGRDVQPGLVLDHADGLTLNNTMHPVRNVRECTLAENAQNRVKQAKAASSRYKGVSFHKQAKKFCAGICIDGKRQSLGLFINEEDAARAYDRAALSAFGTFAKTNFPPTDYPDVVLPKQKACAFRGVVKSGKKFLSQFRHQGQRYYGGVFTSPAEAFTVTNAMRQTLGLSAYPAP